MKLVMVKHLKVSSTDISAKDVYSRNPREHSHKGDENMKKYICPCGYEYDPAIGDPDNGVAPGTAWEDVPEDWLCPTCGLGKDAFEEA